MSDDIEFAYLLAKVLNGIAFALLVFIYLILPLIRRYNRKKQKEVIRVMAEVVGKGMYPVTDFGIQEGIVFSRYDIVFLINNKEETFTVLGLFYNVIEVGDRGILEYTRGKEIISFADKIKRLPEEP